MNNSPISLEIVGKVMSLILNEDFGPRYNNPSSLARLKEGITQIIGDPELLEKFTQVLESKLMQDELEESAPKLPADLTLQKLPPSKLTDSITEAMPLGSEPEASTVVIGHKTPKPIFPSSLTSQARVLLDNLLRLNSRVFAIEHLQPAAVFTAGDGGERSPIYFGGNDSIRVMISGCELSILPRRFDSDSRELRYLTIISIREDGERLEMLGSWKFGQTRESYEWVNSFKYGILIVSAYPLIGV